jgi:hypothetical protein
MQNSPSTNGSFNLLVSQLDRRLGRIEEAIDRLADELDGKHEKIGARVSDLERVKAEVAGGWKFASIVGALAGGVGAFLYHLGMKL